MLNLNVQIKYLFFCEAPLIYGVFLDLASSGNRKQQRLYITSKIKLRTPLMLIG
jgi:hypothetical protein